ncbi:MAG: hypothetical protein ACFBSE_17180 [Prochloraceae cyanobacterium]
MRSLAVGLLEYEKKIPFPYSDSLQLGVEKLQLKCTFESVSLLEGIPDFVTNWGQKLIKDWPVKINCPEEWKDKKLIEDDRVSDFCKELSESFFQEADRVFQELAKNSIDNPDLYVKFRRFLIENPVITERKLAVKSVLEFQELEELLKSCYEPVPDSYKKNGNFSCCGNCGGLMRLTLEDRLKCENKHCAKENIAPEHFKRDRGENVFWLKPGLRYFFHRPGVPELRLEKRLKEIGLEVELYPDRDKYDLHIVFPDNTIWAVDVKFWESAYNLAKSIKKPIPKIVDRPYKEAFFIFADEIRYYGKEYIQEFLSHCSIKPKLRKDRVMFERDFVKKVANKLQGIQK